MPLPSVTLDGDACETDELENKTTKKYDTFYLHSIESGNLRLGHSARGHMKQTLEQLSTSVARLFISEYIY